MWLFLGFGAFVLLVLVGGITYVVRGTQQGEAAFRAALAQRPHLTLAGSRQRTVLGLQVVSRDSEFELRSKNAPMVRVRPSYLSSHPDPTDNSAVPDPNFRDGMSPTRQLPAQQRIDGWIDDLRWPSRLEVIRGTPTDASHVRYFNTRPALSPQPPLADDVHVRGDAPCPDAARAAILAFLEEGSMLCLGPDETSFQVRGGGGEFLDDSALPAIDAAFARAVALRESLRAKR